MYILLCHFSVFNFIGTTELYLLKLHTYAFPTAVVACAFDALSIQDAVEKLGWIER